MFDGQEDGRKQALARRRATLIKLLVLGGLLVFHFLLRMHHNHAMLLADRHNWERTYGVSLSLMSGHGFHDIPVGDGPATDPVRAFLYLEQSGLQPAELDAYWQHFDEARPDRDFEIFLPLATTRVLDLHISALLWRWFGVSWRVLYVAYALASTAACLGVALIARRLTASDWAGLLAGLWFACSPLEAFLTTWSPRDASPLWFTSLGFAWLVCVVERFVRSGCHEPVGETTQPEIDGRSGIECPPPVALSPFWQRKAGLAACLILGLLAVLGSGWRMDALSLVPFLGFSLLVLLVTRREHFGYALAALVLFSAGAAGGRWAIQRIGPPTSQTGGMGFHMAAYGDYERVNLLGCENTYSAIFCDLQTFIGAREIYAARGNSEPLEYGSPAYGEVCRSMFLEEARYNSFAWLTHLPSTLVSALRGFETSIASNHLGPATIAQQRPAALRWLLGQILDNLPGVAPALFFVGLLGACLTGPRPVLAGLLGLFAVYYAAILFVVLPEQRHAGPLLVPLAVFFGAALWTVAGLVDALRKRQAIPAVWKRRSAVAGVLGLIVLVVWGGACAAAWRVSRAERRQLLDDIQARLAEGIEAPETVHGSHNFAVHIAPGVEGDQSGYLLKIVAGERPGLLVCRQLHFPQGWGRYWPKVLTTYHRLLAAQEQSFFVSCLQGSLLGDPRPYACTVALAGDARIEGSLRVDMHGWTHPQVATLFATDDASIGAPRVGSPSTEFHYAQWHVFADQTELDEGVSSLDFSVLKPLPRWSRPPAPLAHIAARDRHSGLWKLANSDGHHFTLHDQNWWSPDKTWLVATGDFNGDGMVDLAALHVSGSWWLAQADGARWPLGPCESDLPSVAFELAGVGDFNGDGVDDLLLRVVETGRLWLARFEGPTLHGIALGDAVVDVGVRQLLVGDFAGRGRAQLAWLEPRTSRWRVATFDQDQLEAANWGTLPDGLNWRQPLVADLDGDGRTDVTGWDARSAGWVVGRSTGQEFTLLKSSASPDPGTLEGTVAGHFLAARRQAVVGWDQSGESLFVCALESDELKTNRWSLSRKPSGGCLAGDFDGDGRDELATTDASGKIWIGRCGAQEVEFESWGTWPPDAQYVDQRVVTFWPAR